MKTEDLDHDTSAEVWDKIARAYEEKFMDLELYNRSYDMFLQLLPRQQGSILDIACGPGNLTHYLLDKAPEMKVSGIDHSPAMIRLAKKNCPGASFRVLDVRKIGTLPGAFEGITAGFILPYLSESARAVFFRDCLNLLVPDGILYLSFVPGPVNASGYQEGSQGDRLFFRFIEEEALKEELRTQEFRLLSAQYFEYKRSDREKERHCVLIAQKRGTP